MKSTPLAVVVLVACFVLGDQIRGISALKCNVCFARKGAIPDCEVLPCNSVDDVKEAYVSLARQQTGLEVNPNSLELTGQARDARDFVCARSVVKSHGSRHKTVTSTCTVYNPAYPPSDKPYPAREYHLNGISHSDAMSDVQKFFLNKLRSIEGDVYVCNEKIGNGPHCGEHSTVQHHSWGVGDGLEGRGRGHGRGRGGHHGMTRAAAGMGGQTRVRPARK